MTVPGFGEQFVHGLACFIDHNICVSKRTEQLQPYAKAQKPYITFYI